MSRKPDRPLRRGWTTGACAAAATKAALTALVTGAFPDPVTIRLPKGEEPAFPLAVEDRGDGWALAGIVKDAGDDPDVTHGATVIATVRPAAAGSGVSFKAGDGVGVVTKPGLPIPPGEPAINPVPREMMTGIIAEITKTLGGPKDVEITISVPGGAELARKTWNPRLGIVGGLSILGTTGIVHPFSCSAWIHAIHRGIDVARATGLTHVAACTGSTSEAAVARLYRLPEPAFLDMGDFAGGLLKYLRRHPLPRLTLAGGFAKMTKLAQGHLDLHSGRSQVDFNWLSSTLSEIGADSTLQDQALTANTANEILIEATGRSLPLGDAVAKGAIATAQDVLGEAPVELEVLIIDRQGAVVGRAA